MHIIQVARLQAFQIGVRRLGLEIIPGEKPVEGIQEIPLRHKLPLPGILDFALREDCEKPVDLGNIQIPHREGNQLIIIYRIKIHRLRLIRPESMLLPELFKQLALYLQSLMSILDDHVTKIIFFSDPRKYGSMGASARDIRMPRRGFLSHAEAQRE